MQNLNLLNINKAKSKLGISRIDYNIIQKGDDQGRVSTLSGSVTEVRCVLLGLEYSRVYMPVFKTKGEQDPAICFSLDGTIPDGGTEPQCQTCAACKHSKWSKNKDKPSCAELYSMYCYDIEKNLVFRFLCKRTFIAPLRQLITVLESYPTTKEVPNHLTLEIKISSREGEQGKCIPHFCVEGELSNEIVEKISRNATRWVGMMRHYFTRPPKNHNNPSQGQTDTPAPSQNDARSASGHREASREEKPAAVPDYTKAGWELGEVPFPKTKGLRWVDLAHDEPLPDNSSGLAYLKRLAKWKDRPDMAAVAKAALHFINFLPENLPTPPKEIFPEQKEAKQQTFLKDEEQPSEASPNSAVLDPALQSEA